MFDVTRVDQTDADRTSAEIILFPKSCQKVAASSQPVQSDQDRLAHALATLDAALAEQRAAVLAWRESLTALKDRTDGLAVGLTAYTASLANLGERVCGINQQTRGLERWADTALERR